MLVVKKRATGVLISLLFLLPGCADLTEVDDLNIVMGLGVDQINPNEVRVSAEIAQMETPSSSQRTGGDSSSKSIIREETGATMEEAIHNLEYSVPHHIFLPNNTVVVFGNAYARNGLDRAIDYLERDRHYRRNQLLVVTRSTARDILMADPAPISFRSQAIRKVVEQSAREHTSINSEQLRFIKDILSPSRVSELALIGISSNNTLQCEGVGLISHGQLVEYLNRTETEFLAMLQGEKGTSTMTITCPQSDHADIGMTYRLLRTSNQITSTWSNSAVHFSIQTNAIAELERVRPKQKLNPQHINQLENVIDKNIEDNYRELMGKLKRDNIDALHLGTLIYRRQPAVWHHMQQDWQKNIYKNSTETFHIWTQIIRNGLSSDSPQGIFSEKSTTPRDGYKEQIQ